MRQRIAFHHPPLVPIPAPFQPSPSPIPGGSRVQRCHKSWRTIVMEKLGLQLLGSASFKVKHEFILLESNFFPGRGDPWHFPRSPGCWGIRSQRGRELGAQTRALSHAAGAEPPALPFEIVPIPLSPPHPAPLPPPRSHFVPNRLFCASDSPARSAQHRAGSWHTVL